MTHVASGTIIQSGLLDKALSKFAPDGSAQIVFSDHRNDQQCIVCTRTGIYPKQTCLACQGAHMKSAPSQKVSDKTPVFLQGGIEMIAGDAYFSCHFRTDTDASKVDTAWLNGNCDFRSGAGDPVAACKNTASYIAPKRRGKFVVTRARVKDGPQCRICMLRTDENKTAVGRVCLSGTYENYIRNVQIGQLIVIVVWVLALCVMGVAALKILFNFDIVQRLSQKMFAVRILVLSFLIKCSCTVTVNVPDADNPKIIPFNDVLLNGLRLCYSSRNLNESNTTSLLRR